MKLGLLSFLILMCLLPKMVSGQNLSNNYFDSLVTVWGNTSEVDSNRLGAVHKLIWKKYLFSNHDTAAIMANQQLELAIKSGNKKFESKAINTLGMVSRFNGQFSQAIAYYEQALAIRLETGDKKGAANTINNIGLIYYDKGQYVKAIEKYTESLKIQEELGNKVGMANAYTNIGLIHHVTSKFDQALDYFERALNVRDKENDKRGYAIALSNIGMIKKEQALFDEALKNYQKAAAMQMEIQDHLNLSVTYRHISMIYNDLHNFEDAVLYQNKSIELGILTSNNKNLTTNYCNLSIIYRENKQYAESIENGLKGYEMAKNGDSPFLFQLSTKILYEAYKEAGDFEKSLDFLEHYKVVSDSINTVESSKKILSQEFEYEYEKKEAVKDAEHIKEIAISVERERNQRIITYVISMGLAIVIILALIIYRRLKITRQQNIIIENQNVNIKESSEKILKIEQEKHELELAQKQRDLEMVNANNQMKLTLKKNLVDDLSKFAKLENPSKELKTLLFEMKLQINTEDKIQTVHDNIETVDSKFLESLQLKFPTLSKTEREICGYIKLNLSIKEIADLRKSSINSVSAVRSRIRTKLEISKDANLEAFIQSI